MQRTKTKSQVARGHRRQAVNWTIDASPRPARLSHSRWLRERPLCGREARDEMFNLLVARTGEWVRSRLFRCVGSRAGLGITAQRRTSRTCHRCFSTLHLNSSSRPQRIALFTCQRRAEGAFWLSRTVQLMNARSNPSSSPSMGASHDVIGEAHRPEAVAHGARRHALRSVILRMGRGEIGQHGPAAAVSPISNRCDGQRVQDDWLDSMMRYAAHDRHSRR